MCLCVGALAACMLVALGLQGARANDPPATAASQPGRAGFDGHNGFLRYEANRLTVNVAGVPLGVLLMEVGRQSGAQIRLEGIATDRPTSDSFTRLPLDEALRRLLTDENFTLIYAQERDPNGRIIGTRLKEVQVYGGAGSESPANGRGRATGVSASVEGASATTEALMERFSSFLDRYKVIELEPGSALAAALSADRASLATLASTAMHSEDGVLRQEAAQVLAGVFDGDEEARALVSGGGGAGMDVDGIADVMRASGGPHAEEFLRNLGRHLRTPGLRLRTNQVLSRLRSPR